MRWDDDGGRYIRATVGPLFAYIETRESYGEPGHPDYEPEKFEWFIAPDDEDKNYRRAYASGYASMMSIAKTDIEAALLRIVEEIKKDI
jgi:hypothetical protein